MNIGVSHIIHLVDDKNLGNYLFSDTHAIDRKCGAKTIHQSYKNILSLGMKNRIESRERRKRKKKREEEEKKKL